MHRLITSLCLLLSVSTWNYAQVKENVFEQLSEHTFKYGDKVGKLHEFKHVFLLDSTYLYDDFRKFNSHRLTQVAINGVFCLAGAIISLPGISLAFKRTEDLTFSNFGVYFLMAGVGISSFGIYITASTVGRKKVEYKKALLGKVLGKKSEIGYWQIEGTEYGLGFVYHF